MKVISFGIIKEIFGNEELIINSDKVSTGRDLENFLFERFPNFKDLVLNEKIRLIFLLNEEQKSNFDECSISEGDEIHIFPPFSGG